MVLPDSEGRSHVVGARSAEDMSSGSWSLGVGVADAEDTVQGREQGTKYPGFFLLPTSSLLPVLPLAKTVLS